MFAIFKSEKSSLIFLACQYINLSCNKNNTLAFIRQLLSTASNIDAASVYKINVRKKCLIILERVNTFLGIVHPVALSPKWTAVASDNWRFNLTAQKVSSGCALNSFVFGVNVYIYTVTINWYIFPQIYFSYWSSHWARWKQADLAVLNANIFPSQLLANEIFKYWKLIASAKVCNYYFTLKKRKGLCQQKLF